MSEPEKPVQYVIFHPDDLHAVETSQGTGRLPGTEEVSIVADLACPRGKAYVVTASSWDEHRQEIALPQPTSYKDLWLDGVLPLPLAALLAQQSDDPADRTWGQIAYDQWIASLVVKPTDAIKITGV